MATHPLRGIVILKKVLPKTQGFCYFSPKQDVLRALFLETPKKDRQGRCFQTSSFLQMLRFHYYLQLAFKLLLIVVVLFFLACDHYRQVFKMPTNF